MWFAWLAYLCVYHIHIWGVKFMVEPLASRKHIFPTWGPGKISSLSRFVADVAPWCPRTQRWDVKLPHQSDSADVKRWEGNGGWKVMTCWVLAWDVFFKASKLTMDLEVWAVEITQCCKEMRFTPSFLLSDHIYSCFFFKNPKRRPMADMEAKGADWFEVYVSQTPILSEAGW